MLTALRFELQARIRENALEREASIGNAILVHRAHVEAQAAEAAERTGHAELHLEQIQTTVEEAHKQVRLLREQHMHLVHASAAAASASAASLAAARTEIESLRAEIKALNENCELYKEKYVQAEWKRRLAEQSAQGPGRQQALHTELALLEELSEQECIHNEQALEEAHRRASDLRSALANVPGQGSHDRTYEIMHHFLSPDFERSVNILLARSAGSSEFIPETQNRGDAKGHGFDRYC